MKRKEIWREELPFVGKYQSIQSSNKIPRLINLSTTNTPFCPLGLKWHTTQPINSANNPADKHVMSRQLSVNCPVSYHAHSILRLTTRPVELSSSNLPTSTPPKKKCRDVLYDHRSTKQVNWHWLRLPHINIPSSSIPNLPPIFQWWFCCFLA